MKAPQMEYYNNTNGRQRGVHGVQEINSAEYAYQYIIIICILYMEHHHVILSYDYYKLHKIPHLNL